MLGYDFTRIRRRKRSATGAPVTSGRQNVTRFLLLDGTHERLWLRH